MRIYQFPNLVYSEEVKPHTLKNTRLVIDGQNFFYRKYDESKIPFVFGSESNELAKYLKNLLNDFKNANVQCFFVFQGGNTDFDKKKNKAKKLNFDFKSNYEFVSPIFMKEICKQVLEEEGVKYATCYLEAKDDCVALAQVLQCSVLSDDIEFCFREPSYIPYSTIDNKTKTNGIICKQFKLKNFLSKYSINEKKAALFATLSDSNIFPIDTFSMLFKKWKISNPKNLYIQNKNLLHWLSTQNENEVLSTVIKFIPTDIQKHKFMTQFEKVLQTIRNIDGGIVTDYLLQNSNDLDISNCDRQWFEKGVATQKIPINYINLYKYKNIQGSWAIENKNGTDSVMLSIDIIIYAYNLLTNFQKTNITVYESAKDYVTVSTESKIPKPTYQCTESVFENGWKDIKQLKLFEHFLNENGINADSMDQFPREARMLFIALIYFAKKKEADNIDVKNEVYCFIVSYVMLHVVFNAGAKNNGISEKDCVEAIHATKKYFICDKEEAEKIYNGATLKTLVELQYCLLHMNYLNALCGSSYDTTKYHRTFNGTFIYKLLLDLNSNKKLFENLFKSAPSVLNYINKLIATYHKMF